MLLTGGTRGEASARRLGGWRHVRRAADEGNGRGGRECGTYSSLVDACLADVAGHVAKVILSIDKWRDRGRRRAGEGEAVVVEVVVEVVVVVVGVVWFPYRYRRSGRTKRAPQHVGRHVW